MIVFPILMCFVSEEVIDLKLLMAVSFSSLLTSLLSPYVGVALWPIPLVTVLRSRLHITETTGCPENQISLHKIKSILVLFIQTFVALAVFLFRTTRFMIT